MSAQSSPPSSHPRSSLLAPWLALGAGLGALSAMPDSDPVAPAAAATGQTISVSIADPAVAAMSTTLSSAPSMTLPSPPPPPPGPAIRFMVGGPSIAGVVRVTTTQDLDPAGLSRPAQLDRIFAVTGEQIRALPDGYHHPLLATEAFDPEAVETESVRREPTAEQWAKLRWCESSGNYQVVNFSGSFRGAYQFDRLTWESVGGTGDPAAAEPAEQDLRAKILYATRGAAPWPYCGRYLEE